MVSIVRQDVTRIFKMLVFENIDAFEIQSHYFDCLMKEPRIDVNLVKIRLVACIFLKHLTTSQLWSFHSSLTV